MKSTTLCFVIEGKPTQSVLLGKKKTGFGCGKFNGFGGKLQAGESVKQAAIRELFEECRLTAKEEHLENAGILDFIFPVQPELNHDVHIFLVRTWRGIPAETSEMQPIWIPVDQIPFDSMWKDDLYWLPQVLAGQKVRGKVVFAANQEDIADMELIFDLPEVQP